MIQVDRRLVRAELDRVFACASDVERWPEWLPHYRWVRFLERGANGPGGGTVEMAAWRPFGPLRWPTWWVSEMRIDRAAPAVRYRHIRGITRGMDVEWAFARRRSRRGGDGDASLGRPGRGRWWGRAPPLSSSVRYSFTTSRS